MSILKDKLISIKGELFNLLYIHRVCKGEADIINIICGVCIIIVFYKTALTVQNVVQRKVGLAAAVYSAVVEMDSQVV